MTALSLPTEYSITGFSDSDDRLPEDLDALGLQALEVGQHGSRRVSLVPTSVLTSFPLL